MDCEIEFLPVGEASRAGDAIVVRYGDDTNYKLMLIDGGHAETGGEIVAHIRKHFGATAILEHVVLTHSDADHASGLRTVLESVPVRNLWLHVPWFHAQAIRPLFADNRWNDEGLATAIRKEYGIIEELLDLAERAGSKVNAPFQAERLGPSASFRRASMSTIISFRNLRKLLKHARRASNWPAFGSAKSP